MQVHTTLYSCISVSFVSSGVEQVNSVWCLILKYCVGMQYLNNKILMLCLFCVVFESELGQNLPTHSLLCFEWRLYPVL
jgi:hypothetical protein